MPTFYATALSAVNGESRVSTVAQFRIQFKTIFHYDQQPDIYVDAMGYDWEMMEVGLLMRSEDGVASEPRSWL